MKMLIAAIFSFIGFSSGRTFFGFETITVYFNKNKIGHWSITTKVPERLTVTFKSGTDTLRFCGFSDCGALDGTAINIKYKGNLILKLTRVSSSGILRHDTVMIKPLPGMKQSFALDHAVDFYATPAIMRRLEKEKIYAVSIQKVIDKEAAEIPVFDLQLK